MGDVKDNPTRILTELLAELWRMDTECDSDTHCGSFRNLDLVLIDAEARLQSARQPRWWRRAPSAAQLRQLLITVIKDLRNVPEDASVTRADLIRLADYYEGVLQRLAKGDRGR